MRIENEDSLKAALKRDINLFVGAGFSVLAKDKTKRNLPLGYELSRELCEEFNDVGIKSDNLTLVSQVFKGRDKARFNEYLVNRFTIKDYDVRYESILDLGVSRIFTTNIDNLFNNIFSKSEVKYLNDMILQGVSFRDSDAVEFLPLHGSILYPDPEFTFTPIEIASAFSNNPTQFQYLVTCLGKAPTLFLGYSLSDAGTLQSLNSTFSGGPQTKARWIQLHEENSDAETYFKSLGFNIIVGDTAAVLDFLVKLKEENRLEIPMLGSGFKPSTGLIPALQDTPVRPIADFFRGNPPIWHDILTKRIPPLARYGELINHIDAGRHVLVSGLPVSGKSTLLMQAAAYCDTGKTKIFEDVLTSEKAEALCRSSKGKADVIIFVDNVGDSVDALDILTSAPNIQVVGADRSVNIGFGSHRFNASKFVNFDCSDLDEADFSRIFELIPPAIRRQRMVVPEVAAQSSPSVFEFIEKNVHGQNISERYKDVLAKISEKDESLHDLFVMICYVFSCHAPVSFDVVSRFLELGGDYERVYSMTESLGKLLSEVEVVDSQFWKLDGDQDYFTPRSLLIAEVVVNRCRNKDFSRVYLDFHNRVPRLFIPRYANFKRFGYRSSFVDRVFEKWEDGEAFYLKSYAEDKSYFLKQQLSIFLGGRKQFELAFKYIDEALTESRNMNPNIRHTHARLLFDANIDKAASNKSLRGHLRDSMNILEGCHEYDKRQTNHALRFAEQSIKYASVFPGREAEGYREKAIGWLKEELAKVPSLRHGRYLLRQLSRN